jgi:TM2 domain-containing membrane protein YozV
MTHTASSHAPNSADPVGRDTGVSYLLWVGGLMGFAGLHRLYNGKIVSGLLWFFTLGLFGVGQFVDLLLIPGMVDEKHLKRYLRSGNASAHSATPMTEVTPRLSDDRLRQGLLKAAKITGGQLSVTQGVMATGESFERVESILRGMVKAGYVHVDNDPKTGVVVYCFDELSPT